MGILGPPPRLVNMTTNAVTIQPIAAKSATNTTPAETAIVEKEDQMAADALLNLQTKHPEDESHQEDLTEEFNADNIAIELLNKYLPPSESLLLDSSLALSSSTIAPPRTARRASASRPTQRSSSRSSSLTTGSFAKVRSFKQSPKKTTRAAAKPIESPPAQPPVTRVPSPSPLAKRLIQAKYDADVEEPGEEIVPRPVDVLMGKGTPINNHAGNINFRKEVQRHHALYDNERDGRKFLIAHAIVDSFVENGSRFLRRNKMGNWEKVPLKRAYDKAQQTLRDGAVQRRQAQHEANKRAAAAVAAMRQQQQQLPFPTHTLS